MKVCEYCLEAIKSRGERVIIIETLYVDETDPEESFCEWCKESEFDVLHEIEWR